MAATPEAKVKKRVREILDLLGAYHFNPIAGQFGRAGVPDIVGCINGRFFGIEVKAGKGKTTVLQEQQLQAIRDAGGIALVINETNLDDMKCLIFTS